MKKKKTKSIFNFKFKLTQLSDPAELRWTLIHSDTILGIYKNKGNEGKRRTYGITELNATFDNLFTTPRNHTDLHLLVQK
jgi:hypothetical protein